MFQYKLFHTPKILKKDYVIAVGEALKHTTNIPQKGIIHIIVVWLEEICHLNESYRKKEGPTDILTFPYRETVKKTTDIAWEIYICLEKIRMYAKERWVTYEEQLKYIIIHGLVHMMGHDHETKKEAEEMQKIEKKIMILMKEKNSFDR